MTKQEQYATGLKAIGYVEQESVSAKYRMFYKEGSSVCYIFLGKSGSVRHNAFKRITGAIAATAQTKAAILRRIPQEQP